MSNKVNSLTLELEDIFAPLDREIWNSVGFDTRFEVSHCMSKDRVSAGRIGPILGLTESVKEPLDEQMRQIK